MKNMSYEDAINSTPHQCNLLRAQIAAMKELIKEKTKQADQIELEHMKKVRPDVSCSTCNNGVIQTGGPDKGKRKCGGYISPCVWCKHPYLSNWEPVQEDQKG